MKIENGIYYQMEIIEIKGYVDIYINLTLIYMSY